MHRALKTAGLARVGNQRGKTTFWTEARLREFLALLPEGPFARREARVAIGQYIPGLGDHGRRSVLEGAWQALRRAGLIRLVAGTATNPDGSPAPTVRWRWERTDATT